MQTTTMEMSKPMKRKYRQDSRHKEWYTEFRFRELPVADPPIPGTPHTMFQKSFVDEASLMQVHVHVNGLCVITAGNALQGDCPKSIEFKVTIEENSANKQKKPKQKHNDNAPKSKESGFVTPSDTLLTVEKSDGTFVNLPCCVFGRVLELNNLVSPDLLFNDALLKGYLAVISPQGRFPPLPIDE
jgi:hypothetical protein